MVDYDIVFIGSPCHHADIVKPVKKFLKKIPNQSKFKLAGFITHSCFPPEKGGIFVEMFATFWVALQADHVGFVKIQKRKS